MFSLPNSAVILGLIWRSQSGFCYFKVAALSSEVEIAFDHVPSNLNLLFTREEYEAD